MSDYRPAVDGGNAAGRLARTEDAAELFGQGLTSPEVAARMNISLSTAVRMKRALGLSRRNGRTGYLIEPDKVSRMAEMIEDGCSFAETARTVGVNWKTVDAYFHGAQWGIRQVSEFANLHRRKPR